MSALLQPEDYLIYKALLLQKFGNAKRGQFAIRENLKAFLSTRLRGEEAIQSKLTQWRLKLRGLEDITANDFITKNAESCCMEHKLDLPLPYTLLSEVESGQIWNRPDKQSSRGKPFDGWKVFRDRFPGAFGVISFSRIGFSLNRNQALVEIGISADWLMGHGELVLLSCGSDGWRVSSELRLWIS
jgi:hypothetical protein